MSPSSSSSLQLWKEYRIPLVCMALGIATLSILLSNKDGSDDSHTDNNGSKGSDKSGSSSSSSSSSRKDVPHNKVEEIVQDMEHDPTIPDLSQEAVARVVDHATDDQKPYQHQGLKKEVYRRLPKVIRKKPKKNKQTGAEIHNATSTTTSGAGSGCCGGKNSPEDDQSTGCCGGKDKDASTTADVASASCSPSGCACSSSSSTIPAPAMVQIDPLLLPYLAEPMKVFYSTITGTAKLFAQQLAESALALGLPGPKLIDIVDYDTEDFMTESSLSIFILSTYNVEGPNDWFLKWLEDTRFDWRVEKGALSKLKFSVFGLGDSAYGDEFCNGPKAADKWLGQMGAQRVWPFGEGDKNGDQGGAFKRWNNALLTSLLDPNQSHMHEAYFSSDEEDSASASEHDDDEDDVDEDGKPLKTKEEKLGLPTIDGGDASEGEMVDLEDMGNVARKIQQAKENKELDEEAYANQKVRAKRSVGETKDGKAIKPREVREMVSPLLYKSLTKQGYKIIGSHSGVKICRWTKAALRGRGFCYKHSFYGIQSHLCMETTPSLACANKCVFCWRHHTNPVGTEWRWKVDDPEFILEGALENHYGMLKQLKGVPGVRSDRFVEATQVKHCALSLVGEPIFYPHINEFVKLLNKKHISSFLVTNAQFPDAIANMDPVTQLYVSVDASTKESLKKIDRPLFRDFWERFLDSLDALGKKGQRTVYRLTLVKDFNTDEIANYVELIRRGQPDFIEIKGVTYCGYGGASGLTMANVPYHAEVVRFVELIQERLGAGYEIAAEHAHSCSILVASTKFKKGDKWYTHIDYDKFFELVESGKKFTSLDYMAETPTWAYFGAPEGGFDPEETRYFRKTKEQRRVERERREREEKEA
ncbi:S-adenosyl-L-methionine-dependent tRNA 4-demethylwyosine synthase [Mortierella polycephala]|uniref:S-adenosyl-L-methionine-dependent tRNA 4-demethylwyosine synthase n=1 Tax=Mortierella polycephala TaxID=41804 RepID=A0A9P6Q3I7_9FUNG|nr:S-adenosyl-L-methionine-dependent tRNA 4-demethylwyosine synthase [Mortierella polycephala]